MQERSFARFAALAAIASFVLALASLLWPLPSLGWDMDAFAEPERILKHGAGVAGPLRASLFLDLLGYYLFITPLVLCVERSLRARSESWSKLLAGCLYVYVLLGMAGAAALAGASPRLVTSYATATGDERVMIHGLFGLLWDTVYGGLWNILEVLMAGIGWLGVGVLLRRERPFAGWVTVALGLSCLVDALGNVLGVKVLADMGLYVYLVLAPLWALGFGIRLLRDTRALTA